MSCRYIDTCPSGTGWCRGSERDFEKCIPFLVTACENWKKESFKQATAAGEIRKEFEILLDDLRKSIHTVRKQMDSESDQDTKVRLHVKLMTLRQQMDKIEEILNRPTEDKKSQIQEPESEWKQAVMKHFTRAE